MWHLKSPFGKITGFLLSTTKDPGTHLDYSSNHRLVQLSICVSASFPDSEVQEVKDPGTQQST